jgi:hypothetical protein
MSITTPSRCCSAWWRFATWFICSGESADVRLLPILSIAASCRSSARAHPHLPARRERGGENNARWIALWTDADRPSSCRFRLGSVRHARPGFQLVEQRDWFSQRHLYQLGVDGISMLFVLLTTFLMPFCILAELGSRSRPASRNT